MEAFFTILKWLAPVLLGGMGASLINQYNNAKKFKQEKKQSFLSLISALKQELVFAQWVVNYNYERIESNLPNKALSHIPTLNVEKVLFGTPLLLPFKSQTLGRLHDYFQQTVYMNNHVLEYRAVSPSNPNTRDRFGAWLGEIKAICVPLETYRKTDSEPSLGKRIEILIQDLSEIRI